MTVAPAVLFVCLGNICRSPLAEAAFCLAAVKAGLSVDADSAGTRNWHAGNLPDPRAQDIALENGVDIGDLRAHQVQREDFFGFTHIMALDHDNLRVLERLRPAGTPAKVALLLHYVSGRKGQAVADPYNGDRDGSSVARACVSAGAEGLVRYLMSVMK